MNTVRSYFATTVVFLIVAIGWWAADAKICCNSSSDTSGGGDVVAPCQNKNRTFHTIEAIHGDTCDDNQTAVSVRKCCPRDQWYDSKVRFCEPDRADDHRHLKFLLWDMDIAYNWVDDYRMWGYNYGQPLCDPRDVVVNVPTKELKWMLQAYWLYRMLPPGYCFDQTPSGELVAQTCHAAAVVCCNSSSVASGNGDVVASCQNRNRTFHTVQLFGNGTCDDNRPAMSIWKCCPLDQSYDGMGNSCKPAVMDGDEQLQRMMHLLSYEWRAVSDVVMVGYNHEQLPCNYPYELLRQPAIYVLPKSKPSKFPEERCFDLSPSGELESGLCMRGEHCLNNTCVHRCCKGDRMIVDGPNGPECILSEKPFPMSAYEIDEDGRQVGRSNRTVLPYYVEFKCSHRDMLNDGFQLTEDGSLYLTYEHHTVPPTEYCVGYSQVTDRIVAFICDDDFVYMVERARASSIPIFCQTSYVASAVCLALTLLVYSTLPSLRNIHNSYVKCYMSHQFVSYIFVIVQMFIENKQGHTYVLLGYITLFVFLSTLCWLNVICFDIYWMMRNNISRNGNTSTLVRLIMYHFYCWGLSSIFICAGLIFKYSQDESLQRFSPDLGEYGCFYYHFNIVNFISLYVLIFLTTILCIQRWFQDFKSDMSVAGGVIFILLPMLVLLAANLILFRLTTNHSSRIKSELNEFNRTDAKTENFLLQKEKFVMSIKLFLVMGIPYFLTVLSIILPIDGAIRYIIYAASSLQGVFICILFVAKPQVITDLRKMFRSSMHHSEPTQLNNISGSS